MAKGGNRLRSYEIMHEIYYPIMHGALDCYALLYILRDDPPTFGRAV
jgi:hypothetical protein